MKPRITYVTPYIYGIPCRKTWACKSDETIEFGNSPQEAYKAWKQKVPKTAIGRWFARVCNKILGLLGI